jgi:integrase
MTTIREGIVEYLALRRSLGFTLRGVKSMLRHFVQYLELEGAELITTELAVRWARLPADSQAATWSARLSAVRQFAAWWSATEPRTEIPPLGLIPGRYRRQVPYIYSDAEIEAIVKTAEQLRSRLGLRGPTYATIYGLLAATGMRISEVIALDVGDVDLRHGVITIRRTKFGKSRLIPLHASTIVALDRYVQHRDSVVVRNCDGFFLAEDGARITSWGTRYNFAQVSRKVGLRSPGGRHGRGPRIHDMRHRFAARTLVAWYRAGLDVERELPKLSTYLGHAHVADTYWYIEAVPELLQLATERWMRGRAGAS